MRIIADKIASVTKNVALTRELRLASEILAVEGQIIAGRLHGQKSVYNQVENCQGRMVTLQEGDILVGALGHRNALHGYSGVVPDSVKVGDRLNVLNLGGVIGQCTSINPEYGKPFEFEVLGSVLIFPDFQSRQGIPAQTSMNALPQVTSLASYPKTPLVFVAGTCMQAGKTFATCQIIRALSSAGLKVGACKVTGVSLMRDTLNMLDYGADAIQSFMDAGVVTTDEKTSLPAALAVIGSLSEKGLDAIVVELGDGILGQYGVQGILGSQELINRVAALIMCANDPVAAWGAAAIMNDTYKRKIDLFSGPTTDNAAGTGYIEKELGIPAINARNNGKELGEFILNLVKNHGC
ncbi:hypothetical protein JNK13_00195 [bacterium]|nr:hypothetical protein [bacterium]